MLDMMGTMDIAFPNLGIYLEDVPQYIYIGDFGIALYGIMIALGMILGIVLAARIAGRTGQNPDTYWDISIWLIVFALIGARIYYVIFFWEAYADNPLQIFNIRAGGLAIYGGVIAGVITAYVYCVIKRLYLPEVLDTVVYGLLVGQIIGRWGNFFNREVFGGYTDNLLAMRLPIEMVRERDITSDLAAHIEEGTNYIQVHPTFLYESLWNLALLLFLLAYLKHRKFKGQIFWMYLAGYGIGRAWIESIRTDQLYVPGTSIPVNMVVAIVLAVLSVGIILYVCQKRKGEPAVGYGLKPAEPAEKAEEETDATAEPAETAEKETDEPAEQPAETETEEASAAAGAAADVASTPVEEADLPENPEDEAHENSSAPEEEKPEPSEKKVQETT